MRTRKEYKWIPKNGVSLDAVEKMQNHFKRPKYPMGEAWFMGEERLLYTELIDKPFEEIKSIDLATKILFEISSGTSCFGHNEEWDEWFKYLLPKLILRSDESVDFDELLVQSVVAAFMSVYWEGIPEEYEGFRNNVINSLSLCLMNERLWCKNSQTNRLRPVFLDTYKDSKNNLRLGWNSGQSDRNLSALMFFCLKYLNQEEMVSWIKSLFLIDDVYWKGALMVWVLGAYDILKHPIISPTMIEKSNPELMWENSHTLGSKYGSIDAKYPLHKDFNDNKDFIPTENAILFIEEINKHLTDNLILDWAVSFAEDKFVAESTYNVPELLMKKLSKNR